MVGQLVGDCQRIMGGAPHEDISDCGSTTASGYRSTSGAKPGCEQITERTQLISKNIQRRSRKRVPTCSTVDWIHIRTAIAKVVLSILGLLLLAASNDNGSSPAPTPQSTAVPMDAQAWSILYSPGMPPHPTPRTGGGWYFDFPTDPNSVHYVLAAVNMAASSYVNARILVTTTGTPEFVYNLQPNNTCLNPAHVRFLLQEKGDDLSGTKGKQYFRWWSNSVAYQLASGAANLRASLTDLSQWTSVLGEKANASAAATAGFKQAMNDLGAVGFSFGGGCFYGHGVRASGGGARFAVTRVQTH